VVEAGAGRPLPSCGRRTAGCATGRGARGRRTVVRPRPPVPPTRGATPLSAPIVAHSASLPGGSRPRRGHSREEAVLRPRPCGLGRRIAGHRAFGYAATGSRTSSTAPGRSTRPSPRARSTTPRRPGHSTLLRGRTPRTRRPQIVTSPPGMSSRSWHGSSSSGDLGTIGSFGGDGAEGRRTQKRRENFSRTSLRPFGTTSVSSIERRRRAPRL
jgi:hypothetical protein